MARIFTDGGEMADTVFWNVPESVSCVSALPTPWESVYCYKVYGYGYSDTQRNIPPMSECYFRARMYINNAGANDFPSFLVNGGNICKLTMDAVNRWQLVMGSSTVLLTSLYTITLQKWYMIQIYFKMADSPNGRFVVYADGVKVLDFTGDTKPSTGTTFDGLGFSHGTTACWIAIDDLALNDTTGGVDNSWCPDRVIVKITPEEDGAHNNWHGSDGDDIDNYLLVQEYPKDDDTTYVYRDGADSGTQDQYDMTDDYDDTNHIITRVYAEARVRKTSADSSQVKLGILPSGGVDQMSPARDVFVNYYDRVVGSEYLVNPVTTVGWVKADIDALEGIVEVA